MQCYPWPASAISRADMKLLHTVRERTRPRVPITRLVVQAIRVAYGAGLRQEAGAGSSGIAIPAEVDFDDAA